MDEPFGPPPHNVRPAKLGEAPLAAPAPPAARRVGHLGEAVPEAGVLPAALVVHADELEPEQSGVPPTQRVFGEGLRMDSPNAQGRPSESLAYGGGSALGGGGGSGL
ncbi:MAG TPA: hypothetical protein VF763_13940 [Candidatus Limnocylindrales bacterium]